MPRVITKSTSKLERLSTALDAYNRASITAVRSPSLETFVALPRAESRLLDVAVECGMPIDHADLSDWASQAVVSFLCAA